MIVRLWRPPSGRTEALVNTVNCVGVMARCAAVRRRYEMLRLRKGDANAAVTISKMFVVDTGQLDGPKHIINFPTKKHWRAPSETGLYRRRPHAIYSSRDRELNVLLWQFPRWGWATEVWIGKMSEATARINIPAAARR